MVSVGLVGGEGRCGFKAGIYRLACTNAPGGGWAISPRNRRCFASSRRAKHPCHPGNCAVGRTERRVRLKYLLDELDLTPLARSKAYQLSGGEKRRLEITRALVTSPKLLLLDEPFSGIDPIAVYEVQKIIRRLKERGLGILVTDHNVRETLKLVDRAYLIHKGEVVYEGDAARMVEDPKAREIYLGPDFNM